MSEQIEEQKQNKDFDETMAKMNKKSASKASVFKPIEVEIDNAVLLNGKKTKKIIVHPPKVSSVRKINTSIAAEDPMGADIELLSKITGISVKEIEDLYLKDYELLYNAMISFL